MNLVTVVDPVLIVLRWTENHCPLITVTLSVSWFLEFLDVARSNGLIGSLCKRRNRPISTSSVTIRYCHQRLWISILLKNIGTLLQLYKICPSTVSLLFPKMGILSHYLPREPLRLKDTHFPKVIKGLLSKSKFQQTKVRHGKMLRLTAAARERENGAGFYGDLLFIWRKEISKGSYLEQLTQAATRSPQTHYGTLEA